MRILFLYLVAAVSVYGQLRNFINYTIEKGLPEAQVMAITQCDEGYLYFSTIGSGVARFDGKEYKVYTTEDGLAGNNVQSLFTDDSGKIWVGTAHGLSVIDNGKVISFPDSLLSSPVIWRVFVDSKSVLWIGTGKGLTKYSNGSFIKNPVDLPQLNYEVWDITEDSKGNIWVAATGGLIKIGRTDTSAFLDSDNYSEVFSVREDSKGNLWAGTASGIYLKKGDNFFKPVIRGYENDTIVYSIFEDSKGDIYFSTEKGLVKKRGDSFTLITQAQGLVYNSVLCAFEDRENNLWFGTYNGVSRITHENYTMYGKQQGMDKEIAWSVFVNKEGEVIAGTGGAGLKRLVHGKFVPYLDLPELSKGTIWDTYEDNKGDLWIGTEKGLFLYSGGRLTNIFRKYGIGKDDVMDIKQDNEGNIWAATYFNGICKIDESGIKRYKMEDDASAGAVFSIEVDSSGRLWAGTYNGLYRLKDSLFIPVLDEIYMGFGVMDITIDYRGTVWAGMYEKGVAGIRSDTGEIIYLGTEDGLSDNSVLFAESDNNKHLWLGTNKGINILDLEELYNSGKKNIFYYAQSEGFPGLENNQGAAWFDKATGLWFGTVKGIVNVDPATVEISEPESVSLYITGIDINYGEISLSGFTDETDYLTIPSELELPHSQNHLTFRYKGLNYRSPAKLTYRYTIDHLDKGWSPKTTAGYVRYPNIDPGSYKFRLQVFSGNSRGPLNEVVYAFTINPPFYKTWWFYLIIILTIVGVGWSAYSFRTSALNREKEQLKRNLEQRLEYETMLRESEKDYRELFENAHDPILVNDPDTMRIVDANKSASEVYEYSLEDLIGMDLSRIVVDPELAKENFMQVMNGSGRKNFTTIHRAKSGKELHLDINAAAIRFKGKKAILGILRDMTAYKETEKALILAKEKAEKSERMKSDFLAQMSHEIRTPVNTIVNFTSLVAETIKSDDDEDLKFSFSMIERGSRRLVKTIESILSMSQIQTGNYDLSIEKIDISKEIIGPLYRDYLPVTEKRGIELRYINDLENTRVTGDRFSLEQLISNLLDNAIKYTREGWVEIRTGNVNGKVTVEVEDTGIGIDKEFLPRLFTPFSQEESGYTRKFEGTGLGLALVQKYAEMNNAEIRVESEKGKGSKFIVIFG